MKLDMHLYEDRTKRKLSSSYTFTFKDKKEKEKEKNETGDLVFVQQPYAGANGTLIKLGVTSRVEVIPDSDSEEYYVPGRKKRRIN